MVGVEQWAEIRRLHFVRGLSKREISRRMRLARDTVDRAVRSEQRPAYRRAPAGSKLDPAYARFHEEYDECFAEWCDRLRAEFTHSEGRPRLIEVHNLLVDLVVTLDVGEQYTRHLKKVTS